MNGMLMRVKRRDFMELMQAPLLHRLSYKEAMQRIEQGAIWIDVRHPSEYRFDKLSGALNVPLNDIRNAISALNRAASYIAYCQGGRLHSGASGI